MIGVIAMFVSFKDLVMRIPIVKMMRERKQEKERTVDLVRELKRQQAENERRVWVLDQMTYPHTHRRAPHDPD